MPKSKVVAGLFLLALAAFPISIVILYGSIPIADSSFCNSPGHTAGSSPACGPLVRFWYLISFPLAGIAVWILASGLKTTSIVSPREE